MLEISARERLGWRFARFGGGGLDRLGFGVGTGGYREIFGTGIYPIGVDGVAALTFDFVDSGQAGWGKPRDRR